MRTRGEIFSAHHHARTANVQSLLQLADEDAGAIDHGDAGAKVVAATGIRSIFVAGVRLVEEDLGKELLVPEALLEVEVAPVRDLRRAERGGDFAPIANFGVTRSGDQLRLGHGPEVEPRLAGVLPQAEVVLHRLPATRGRNASVRAGIGLGLVRIDVLEVARGEVLAGHFVCPHVTEHAGIPRASTEQ